MTTYQLEAFITLAEMLNFTKASKLMHMTQPNFSRIIFSLEQEIGVKLFVRSKRDVSLTSVGEIFYDDALMMMSQYKSSVAKAKELQAGIYGSINLGYLGPAMLTRLPDIISVFKDAHPKIDVRILEFSYSKIIRALKNDEIDIAFAPQLGLDSIAGIQKRRLFTDEMCVVVNHAHKLADRTEVDVSELSDDTIVMLDPKISERDYEMLWSLFQKQNIVPKDIYLANSLNNLIMLVSCGYGISILAGHMRQFCNDNMVFIRLLGHEDFFEMSCAWHDGKNPSVPFMLEALNIDV